MQPLASISLWQFYKFEAQKPPKFKMCCETLFQTLIPSPTCQFIKFNWIFEHMNIHYVTFIHSFWLKYKKIKMLSFSKMSYFYSPKKKFLGVCQSLKNWFHPSKILILTDYSRIFFLSSLIFLAGDIMLIAMTSNNVLVMLMMIPTVLLSCFQGNCLWRFLMPTHVHTSPKRKK